MSGRNHFERGIEVHLRAGRKPARTCGPRLQLAGMMECGVKGPFLATQLNSTRRRVELSCVAIDTLTDATPLSPAIGNATDLVAAYSQSARSRSVELS